jgi:hypothetical protein
MNTRSSIWAAWFAMACKSLRTRCRISAPGVGGYVSSHFLTAPPFSRVHKVLVLFKFGFVVSSVDYNPQSHVSIVPTTNLRFANSVATTSARGRSREGGKFPVVDPRPRPSRLPREVFSGLQEAIGLWVIMNAGDIFVNSCNHYSRVTLMILFFSEEVLCHYESRKVTERWGVTLGDRIG